MPPIVPPAAPSAAGFTPVYRRVRARARRAFRAIACPHRRADLAAEAVALAWRLFKTGAPEPGLARRAVRLAAAGATLCGPVAA